MILWFLLLGAIFLVVLLYVGKGYWAWVSALAIGFSAWWLAGVSSPTAFSLTLAAAVLTARFEGHEVEELDVDDLDDVD